MPATSINEHIRSTTERATRFLINDLKAIPPDKLAVCPGGCARPPLVFVAECALLNGYVADYLAGRKTEPRSKEERDAFLLSVDTLDKALDMLGTSTQRLFSALETVDANTLGEVSDQPLGIPMSRFALAILPAMHMMYHDGQLNYVQTLYGDDKMHWTD